MGFLGFGKKNDISAHTPVGITERGKEHAERNISQGSTYTILSALEGESPQSVSRLSESTGYEINELKARVKDMEKQGYVKTIPTD